MPNLFDGIIKEDSESPVENTNYSNVPIAKQTSKLSNLGNISLSIQKPEKPENPLLKKAREIKNMPTPEQTALETPWVDPLPVLTGGFSVTGFTALKAGAGILSSLGRATLAGSIGAVADIPIGTVTDLVAKNHPNLALPFNVLVGIASGSTLEKFINAKVISSFIRIKKVSFEKLTQADFDQINKISAELEDMIKINKPKQADEILERRITELAQEAIVPSIKIGPTQETVLKKGWEKTAEDLVQEKPITSISPVPVDVPAEDLAPPIPKVLPKPTSTPDEPPRLVNPDGTEMIGGRLTPDAAETTRELARKYTNSETDVDEIEKYVDSINIDKIDTTEDAKRFIVDTANEIKNKIQTQRRGVITHDETTRMAIRSGITEDELIKLKPGKILNAEESLAASMINTASAKKTIDAAKHIASGTATEQELLDFRLILERHQIIQAAESGLATEAGRVLSARNIIKNAEQIKLKNFSAIIQALGGRDVTEEMAKRLAMIDPDNIQQVNKFIQRINLASTTDKVFEIWVNSLLTSPITHITNFTSNTITFLNKFPEKIVASGFDAIRSAFTGKPRTRYIGEVTSEMFGITQGLKDGIRNALWSFRTGLPSEYESKLEVRTFHAVKGMKGEIIRLPGRSLVAADEFFKAINYSTELYGLAFREATKLGLTGKAKANKIADLIVLPTTDIYEKATSEMLYRTFQKPLSSFMGTVAKARMEKGVGGTLFRFIVPFIRTPTNIAKYGLERTPIGFIYTAMKQFKDHSFETGELMDRLARATFGTVLGAVTYQYALEGRITGGGPKDKVKRDALYRIGWQPYSIKIKDKYYSYRRLEPLGSILGMAADMAENGKYTEESKWSDLTNRMVTSFGKNITSKTFLRGVSDALDAMSDPDRYGPAWINSFGGTIIPRAIATGAKASDEYIRDTPDLGSYIKSEIPYLSHDLLPKRNIWGDPLEREGSFIMKFVSPIQVSKEKGILADKEILRLNISIGKPLNKISIPGDKKPTELTPKQYDKLIVLGGARAKKSISDYISNSSYGEIDDESKGKMIKKLYDSAFNVERNKLRNKLIVEITNQRRK